MFRAVLAQLMKKLASSEVRYGGVLEGFRDVLAADATLIKLHRLLAQRFSGTRTNSSPAAAKLHLVMSVRGSGAHKVRGSWRATAPPIAPPSVRIPGAETPSRCACATSPNQWPCG